MKAIDLLNAEIGTVSSCKDGSVAFRVISPELRPSEAGAIMAYHGKACRVLIAPHEGAPEETVLVNAMREHKTAGQRLRAVMFLIWRAGGEGEPFQSFYDRRMDKLIDAAKVELEP